MGSNDPRAVKARRRHPADGARIRPAPGQAAPGRIDSYGLPGFYRIGVELRYFSLQRSDPPFEAYPTAISLRLSARTRHGNRRCANEQRCKNTHLYLLFRTILIAPDQCRNSQRDRSTGS